MRIISVVSALMIGISVPMALHGQTGKPPAMPKPSDIQNQKPKADPKAKANTTAKAKTGPAKDSFVSRLEAALDYNYVRMSTLPTPTNQSSSFSMSGVSATAAYRWRWHLSPVVDFSGTHINGIGHVGTSLTLLTTTAGGRYTMPTKTKFSPFVQVLAGEAHAAGSVYPANAFTSGGTDSAAVLGGVGVDHPLNHVVSVRIGLAYQYTGLPNSVNNRQSEFRGDGGLVIHFGDR